MVDFLCKTVISLTIKFRFSDKFGFNLEQKSHIKLSTHFKCNKTYEKESQLHYLYVITCVKEAHLLTSAVCEFLGRKREQGWKIYSMRNIWLLNEENP